MIERLAQVRAMGRVTARTARALLGLMAPAVIFLGCRDRETSERTAAPELVRELLEGEVTSAGIEGRLVYRLFVPSGYDPTRSHPLILYFHGSGMEGTDNRKQLGVEVRQLIDRANAVENVFLLVPQCPRDKWILGESRAPHVNYVQSQRRESDGLKLALVALDEVRQRYSIDSSRVYVAGFSAGGAGTWDLVSRHPERQFAAAVPMTGISDPSQARRIATLPIWAFHGALDRVSPVTNTREMVAALRALGSPVRYTEYENEGHAISLEPFAEDELVEWLLAQRAPSSFAP